MVSGTQASVYAETNSNFVPISCVRYHQRTGCSISNYSFKCDDFLIGNIAYDIYNDRLTQIMTGGETTPYLTGADTGFCTRIADFSYSTGGAATLNLDNNHNETGCLDSYFVAKLSNSRNDLIVISAQPDFGRIYYLLVMNDTTAIKTISVNTQYSDILASYVIGAPESPIELNPGYAMEFSFYASDHSSFTDGALVITHSEELKITSNL